MTVEITCDRGAVDPIFEVNTPPEPAVNYVLRVRSVHGCVIEGPAPGPAPPTPPPTPPPGGPGSIEAMCSFTRTTQEVDGSGLSSGVMYMTYTPGRGTQTEVYTTGMTEGLHGIHIHNFGDLSDTEKGTSTGSHYNPLDESEWPLCRSRP